MNPTLNKLGRSVWPGCVIAGCLAAFCAGCPTANVGSASATNPFVDLAAIELDGLAQPVTSEIIPLGSFDVDQVFQVRVEGDAVEVVLLLLEDPASDESGVIVGGVLAGQTVAHRVQTPGRYFVFVQLDGSAGAAAQPATISAQLGDPQFRPPPRQIVRVLFEDDFLTDPGLLDPESGTDEELDFLENITETVRQGIVDQLRDIFADTPIEIIELSDPDPDEPFSTLTYRPDRVLAEDSSASDVVLILSDPDNPECAQRVVFGQVLPDGIRADAGNAVPDDDAIVNVGSFQGRGLDCRTAVTNSLNFVILALSQTGAHEIGHLVGLFHTGQIDIMNRATLAFQRQLTLGRGQLEIETPNGVEVLTSIIQDPDIYFQSAFDRQ